MGPPLPTHRRARQRLRRAGVIAMLAVALAAAEDGARADAQPGARPVACARPARAWQRTELYFGRSAPAGPVTDAQFQDFLDTEVTPRFPDGLTVLHGRGQWRAAAGAAPEAEDSTVLVLVVPPGRDTGARIEALRQRYKQAFQQQSVLRVDSRVCASF